MIHLSDYTMNFEKEVVDVMVNEKCTMREALDYIFFYHEVDTDNVFDLVDFLEKRLYDLDKVQTIMMVYTGQSPDFQLTRFADDGKTKTKRADKG